MHLLVPASLIAGALLIAVLTGIVAAGPVAFLGWRFTGILVVSGMLGVALTTLLAPRQGPAPLRWLLVLGFSVVGVSAQITNAMEGKRSASAQGRFGKR